MIENQTFLAKIRQLISTDELKQAVRLLQYLLKNSPKLNEAILQSARLSDISNQVRLGLVDDKQASLSKNQIRAGILDLLDEIEIQEAAVSEIKKEVEIAISIVNSKNVVTGKIEAVGDIHIGDKNTTITQTAEKIYNIEKIDKADFS